MLIDIHRFSFRVKYWGVGEGIVRFFAQIVPCGIKKNKFFLICAHFFVPLHAENRHYEQTTINHGNGRHVARGECTGIRQPA